jgi:uncharacterized membrane protein YagU involved in acid resistance
MHRIIAGALAGLVATIPMSICMLAGYRRLPWGKRDPLPPEQITKNVLSGVGLRDDLSERQEQALVVLNHFGYGATMGAVYGMLPHSPAPAGSLACGIAYGLSVWAASYLGWLPAAGLYRSATEEPRQRNELMIAAHVVWGASLGITTAALLRYAARRRARTRRPYRGLPKSGMRPPMPTPHASAP